MKRAVFKTETKLINNMKASIPKESFSRVFCLNKKDSSL